MNKRHQKIVNYAGAILGILLLVIVVACVYVSSSQVQNEGGMKQAIIVAGREVKDIVHEIQKD